MENQKPKTNPIFEESVQFSFNLERYFPKSKDFTQIDKISGTVTFQDFVQKLYLFHNFCSETDRSYFITLSNSPSINLKKSDDDVPF